MKKLSKAKKTTKFPMLKTWDNAFVDKGGWTDADIQCMVESKDFDQYSASEQKFIKARYADLKKRGKLKTTKKLKTFNVAWLERHCVNVLAKDEEDACAMILEGNFDEANESAEYDGECDATEIHLK